MSTLAIICLVVGISDGDTIKVRCGEGPQERVRLADVDAPESGQAHGRAAKQALSDLVFGKSVELEAEAKRDRYGRLVAQVYVAGLHVNAAIVDAGYAWCDSRYKPGQWCSPAQERARSAKLGLWADATPMAPWEWRRAPPLLGQTLPVAATTVYLLS